jgi:hypothetical protein
MKKTKMLICVFTILFRNEKKISYLRKNNLNKKQTGL